MCARAGKRAKAGGGSSAGRLRFAGRSRGIRLVLSDRQLADLGVNLPPFHGLCRTNTIPGDYTLRGEGRAEGSMLWIQLLEKSDDKSQYLISFQNIFMNLQLTNERLSDICLVVSIYGKSTN